MAEETKEPKNEKTEKKIEEKAKAKPVEAQPKAKPAEVKVEPPVEAKPAETETKAPKPKAQKLKLSKKLADLIGEIEKLSVLELADLVKALEEKFGVSGMPAAAPATAPVAGSSAEAGPPGGQASEQTTFNVILASPGANKISAIKMVREINQTLGLKEAKDLVESTPKEILTGVNKSTAEEAKKKLEGVGASVELK